jgi:serine kinase of HPr protein (carbohydrate metabolism regulator)
LIPEDLKSQAEQQARREGLSLSGLIRQTLEKSIQKEGASEAAFFSRRPWVDSAPTDLSEHHDDYLYGDG